ncbi:hypothetical protein ONZ45_g11214 [Pleurotus djamor]|nr:hypothetical protein ONZ45_g11214 [Pleurotus djamor]
MIIPVELDSSSQSKLPSGLAKLGNDEVVLVELQGTLEVDGNENDGKLVGRLKMDGASSKPTLMIGHHLLEGKIATLAKPLAILHRSSSGTPEIQSPSKDQDDSMDCDQPDANDRGEKVDVDGSGSGAAVERERRWEIVALVKKKILFSKRPMPIVKSQG